MSAKSVCDMSCGQMHEFALALDKAGFNADLVQRVVGSRGNKSAKAMYAAINDKAEVVEPKIITIDRSTPFNPAKFIGKGWSIWRGPADGNGLEGEEEQDTQSLAITELNPSKIRLVSTLREGETVVGGEENLRRLREANHVCLDAGIFQTFWNHKELIPPLSKELTNGATTYIFFAGTTLRSPDGDRHVLYLFFDGSLWRWFCRWLANDWHVSRPSAVLAS